MERSKKEGEDKRDNPFSTLSIQIEKSWGSDGNEKKLQSFGDEKLQFLAIQKQINVVLSGIIDNNNLTPAKHVNFEQDTTKSVSDLAWKKLT